MQPGIGEQAETNWEKALSIAAEIEDEEVLRKMNLAALSLEHGAELCSADPDFTRFTGVRWNNPLKHR